MAAFFIYSIKVALCLAVFYLFYKLLLSRETFHTFNRIVLLACVALSLLVPVVHVTTSHVSPTININNDITSVIYVISATVIEENKGITWIQLLFAAYIIGVVLFLIAEVVSLLRLWHIIASGRKAERRDGAQVVVTEGNMPPFSWFRWIVVNRRDYEENGCEIITHELAHIRRRHSIDILLCDMLIVLQWFNPAAWLLKRELQDVHEYEADEVVLSDGVDVEHYQMLLIRKAVGDNKFLLANNFNKNSLKKRIKMMSKKKSNPWQRLRAVVVLPLAVVAIAAFARQEVVQMVSHIEAESEDMVDKIIPEVIKESPVAEVKEVVGDVVKPSVQQYAVGVDSMKNVKADTTKVVKVINVPLSTTIIDLETGEVTVPDSSNWDVKYLKGEDAVRIYGEPGKGGVVYISNKEGIPLTPIVTGKSAVVYGIDLNNKSEKPKLAYDVDTQPEFPGGVEEMKSYMHENIRFPKECQERGIDGVVLVRFIVTPDGDIENEQIIRSVDPQLSAEALRVVRNMPKWKPATKDGKNVVCEYNLPVNFKLQ